MATAFRPGISSNCSSDGTSLRCGLVRPTASSRDGLASQTAATCVSGHVVKLRMRLGPQYPAPTMPTESLSMSVPVSPRLLQPCTQVFSVPRKPPSPRPVLWRRASMVRKSKPPVRLDDVRELLLGPSEVHATANEYYHRNKRRDAK